MDTAVTSSSAGSETTAGTPKDRERSKDVQPSITNLQSIDTYSGYFLFGSAFLQVDFEVPAEATEVERDAAFLAALSRHAEVNYVVIGNHKQESFEFDSI